MHNAAFRGSSRIASPAFQVIDPLARVPVLVVCDHASNHVPPVFAGLGLGKQHLDLHIGWDIGAAIVATELARRLGCTAILSGVSRLVIDCNRPLAHPTLIVEHSGGIEIPGNRGLAPARVNHRIAAWHRPYHQAIAGHLRRLDSTVGLAALVSVHSFTPELHGRARPWAVGVLWNRDRRFALAAIDALRRRGHLVGDNEPYSGRHGGYTVDRHATAAGRPNVTFEIRQDLIAEPTGARNWGRLLAGLMRPVLARQNACRTASS